MNEEKNTELQLASEPLAQSEPPQYHCHDCNKSFNSANALRMHNMRVHSPAGQRGYQWKRKKMSKNEYLEHRRIKQKQLREGYYARGLDSRGQPRPAGYQPHKHGGGNTGMKMPPWTPERRAKFDRTWRKKLRDKQQHRGNKQIRYVYPEPEQEKQPGAVAQTINYCPNCGEHLTTWRNYEKTP